MAFEYLKKGLSGLSNVLSHSTGAERGGDKRGLKGKSFEEGEKELSPDKESTKARKPPDNRTFLEKADDKLGLGQRFRTDAWTKRQWRVADAKLAVLPIKTWLIKYRPQLEEACKKECSTENLAAHDALKAGISIQDFAARFMVDGGDETVNLPGTLMNLARAKAYDKMDLSVIMRAVESNLTDTTSRLRFDPSVMKLMFTEVTGMTPPDEVDQGYKD